MIEVFNDGDDDRDPETAGAILRVLLDRYDSPEELNARTDGDNMTALHIAAQRGNDDAVQQLLNKDGIDSSVKNSADQTPLDVARSAAGGLAMGAADATQRVVELLASPPLGRMSLAR